MKRNYIQRLLPVLLFGVLIFTGCADDALMEEPEVLDQTAETKHEVWTLMARLGEEDAASRLAYYKMPGSFMTAWEEGDQIVANASPGNGLEYAYVFDLVDGAGTTTATFQCDSFPTGYAPENFSSNAWTVYFPGSRIKCEQDYFDMTYMDQVQHGNDNFDHIEKYYSLRLQYGDTENSYRFNFKDVDFTSDLVQQSSCMKFNLSGFSSPIVPVKIDLEYMDASGSVQNCFYTHNYSYIWWNGATPSGITASRLSLGLAEFAATQSITAYMMMSSYPVTVEDGGTFRVYVTDAEGKRYSFDKSINRDATLEGGLVHQINCWGEWKEAPMIDGMDDPENGIVVLQEASVGKGTDIVVMGDGFAAEHFSNGNYEAVMKQAVDAFFSVEPYTSLRKYFNVYYIKAVSDENHDAQPYYDSWGNQNGATMGKAKTKFSTQLQEGSTSVSGNHTMVQEYVQQTLRHKGGTGGTPLTDESEVQRRAYTALSLVQVNVNCYAGTCWMWWTYGSDYGDAYSIAYTPLGSDGTGEDCRLTTIHEAGGHGFGKLADEYQGWYFSSFSASKWDELRNNHDIGVFRNVNEYWTEEDTVSWSGLTWDYTTADNVYWTELLRPKYSYTTTEGLGMYKGGWTFNHMFCRPTDNSVMRNQFGLNGQSFNAISRWAIWYRLMRLTGCTTATDFKSSLDEFIAFDQTITGWENNASGNAPGNAENFVEKKLEPLAPPVLRRGEWINGRFVEVE